MQKIFKTWKKATYFKGNFKLRDNENWAHSPIEFPTVFRAYGKAIKTGNWWSSTSINTPNYVVKEYFDEIGHGKHDLMASIWYYCKQLSNKTWTDVEMDKVSILNLIKLANYELNKLNTLN